MKQLLLAISLIAILSTGCTENVRAKKFGGNMIVPLPTNTKLVNATWKDAQLWYLYRPMTSNEVSVTSTFKEKSNFGYMEGTITFVESK